MTQLQPLIRGVPALQYLADVPDNGRALIIVGDHPEKNADVSSITDFILNDFMAINAAGEGRCVYDYCATLHSYNVGLPEFPLSAIHHHTQVIGLACGCEAERVDMTIDAEPVGGTSALFAVIAGLVLGYKQIYLAGVRLEPGSIYHDEHVEANWKLWKPVLAPHLLVIGDSWLKELYS